MNSNVLAFSELWGASHLAVNLRAWAKKTTIRSLAQGRAKRLYSTGNVGSTGPAVDESGRKAKFCVHPPSLVIVRNEDLPITTVPHRSRIDGTLPLLAFS
jgi:hypothetical protein